MDEKQRGASLPHSRGLRLSTLHQSECAQAPTPWRGSKLLKRQNENASDRSSVKSMCVGLGRNVLLMKSRGARMREK